jgi:hypothetical protein
MPFKQKFLLFLLLVGFGLAVSADESAVADEAPAAPKPEAQAKQAEADKAGEENSQPGFSAEFTPFTPSEEILTDRPAAFPADI